MQDGSRHERAAIVVVAYIIGFTTAYIAFGVTQLQTTDQGPAPVQNTAAVVEATHPTTQTAPKTPQMTAKLTPTGLYAVIAGKDRIVSATEPTPDTGVLAEGFNTSIADYSVSPSGAFLYFCEVPSVNVTSCRPYVYSVAYDTVYPVTQNGARVAFPTDAPKATWDSAGRLTVNGTHSQSVTQPWQL